MLSSVLFLMSLAAPSTSPVVCDGPVSLGQKNHSLQTSLEEGLRQEGLDLYVEQGKLAVAVVDLSRPGRRYYAGVRDDAMVYAASLPKIAILLAVVQLAEAGVVAWAPDFAFRLHKMITISDNTFASWGWDLATVGGIAKVMQQPEYCLYSQPYGGLWVGRPYRPTTLARRDPLFNITHGATARQTARFYALLDAGLLVSPYWSERMLDLMAPPEHTHKFVAGLSGRRGVRFLARKSGTWMDFHADSALIEHFSRRYVLVGLSETPDGEAVLRRLAPLVDDIIERGEHRHTMHDDREEGL